MFDYSVVTPWNSKHPASDVRLRPGLNFHYGDETDSQDHQWVGTVEDRFRLVVVLNGRVKLTFGDKKIELGGEEYVDTHVNMALVSLESPVQFCRQAIKDNYCCRVSIGVSDRWLFQAFDNITEGAKLLRSWRHLDIVTWQASQEALKLAEDMIKPKPVSHALSGIFRENRAISLMLEALTYNVAPTENATDAFLVNVEVPAKWQGFRQWILLHAAENLTIDMLATNMNTTTSTLQRQFKQHFNQTVFEFINICRLELGMKRLLTTRSSITSIAMEVGYSGSASFCTAFKRYFGLTPSQARTS
ncbi:MAG: AraC family transcriptional regulator [Paraglaciecola sp.]|uniref:helix-turn-helix transcriptional regulator n=1 Tax=Paraglaciecola sp. TaxID=1920173 RepID=UPI0032991CDB